MPDLASQHERIFELLDEALARTVRLAGSKKASTTVPPEVSAISSQISSSSCDLLDAILARTEVYGVQVDLYEQWLAQSLSEVKTFIQTIVPGNVVNTAKSGEPTLKIFETPIDNAQRCLNRDPSGVFPSVKQLFAKQEPYKQEGVKELANIKELGEKIRDALSEFRNRDFTKKPSYAGHTKSGSGKIWVVWFIAFVLAIASIPSFYYYNAYKSSSAPSLIAAQPIVEAKWKNDAAVIREKAIAPEKSFFEKAVGVVKDVWELIDKVPKIFSAVVVIWGVIMKLFRR